MVISTSAWVNLSLLLVFTSKFLSIIYAANEKLLATRKQSLQW